MASTILQYKLHSKFFSDIIKGYGLQLGQLGSLFCETSRLYGRSFDDMDLGNEVFERTGVAGFNRCVNVDQRELEQCIITILKDELRDRVVKFEHPDVFWTKRVVWCKNGGHAKVLQRSNADWNVLTNLPLYRKVAVESWQNNPLYMWDGRTFISASDKNEPGRRRLLLACDTVTYIAFEHFLKPIEKSWRNNNVLLNPDLKGRVGIVERIKNAPGVYNVALDYDDFNSQHSLASMKTVIKTVGLFTKYPIEYLNRLVASIDNQYASVAGHMIGRLSGGLCSGHRLTSFINSILNRAYMLLDNNRIFEKNFSLHTGDDTIARLKNLDDTYDLIGTLHRNGFKLNNSKQSIGKECSEFLRMGIGRSHAFGYVCRVIASTVNGNWENTEVLSCDEYLQSILNSIFSIKFRGGVSDIGLLFVDTLNRKTNISKKILKGFVLGDIAVGNGPIFGNTGTINSYNIKRILYIENTMVRKLVDELISGEPDFATKDYLSQHLTGSEIYAAYVTGFDVSTAIKSTSYMKSLMPNLSSVRNAKQIFLGACKSSVARKFETISSLLTKKRLVGVFENQPIMQMLKDHLTDDQLRICCYLTGIDPPVKFIKEFCFGESPIGCIIRGVIPYSDAAMFGKIAGGAIVYVNFNIYY